jgi:hypothetical protein
MTGHFDDELDALLRGGGERLAAPPELWDSVRGRAKRRRLLKASVAVASVVVVVAGAVPAVIAVHNDSAGNGSVTSADKSGKQPSNVGGFNPVTRPTSLAALTPETISFVSQDRGWVSGELNVDGGQIDGGLGETTDGGHTWVSLKSAPTGLVRMATGGPNDIRSEGFSFGTGYQVTYDGGVTWKTLASPGYIEDLEVMDQHVWALVKSDVSSPQPRLFTATLGNPNLVQVAGLPSIPAEDSAITLARNSIYVSGGRKFFYSNDLGATWTAGENPCRGEPQAFATWSPLHLAAECTPKRGKGSIFTSMHAGAAGSWTDITDTPHGVTARVGTLSAGTRNNFLITTGTGPAYVTTNAGLPTTIGGPSSWKLADAVTGPVTFAAYIDDAHIVGLRGGSTPAYIDSTDAGRAGSWTVSPFVG